MTSRWVVVLVGLVLCLSCKPQAAHESPAPHPVASVPAARYLPAAVQLLAVTDDLQGFLAAAGRKELVSRFRKLYEETAFQLVRDVGYDVTSPEALADLGIDVNAQAGVAVLAERGAMAYAIFVTLAHPERFKNILYLAASGRLGKLRMSMSVIGDVVVVGQGETAVMLFERTATLIVGPRALGLAQQYAGQAQVESLAHQPGFESAMQRVDPARPLYGYFDARAAFYLQAGLDPRWPGKSEAEAWAAIDRMHAATLAELRGRAAPVDEIATVDGRYRAARKVLADDEFSRRMRRLAGDLGAGSFALDLSPTGADLSLELDAPKSSVLRRLFVAHDGEPALVRGLDQPPALLASVSLDMPTVLEVARALELPLAELNILFGIDLQSEIAPLLSGEIGVAVSAPEGGPAAVDGAEDLGISAVIGVKDAAKVKAFLGELIDKRGLGSLLAPAGAQRWKLTLADFGAFSVTLSGEHLVVSRDPALAERIGRKRGGLSRQGPLGLLSPPSGGAGVALVELVALAALEIELGHAPPAKEVHIPWHDPKAPKSAAYQAKLAELQKAEDDLVALEEKRQATLRRRKLALLEPLGRAAFFLAPTPQGLALQASYRTTGPTVISILGKYASDADAPAGLEDEALAANALREKRATLEAELDEIYQRDQKALQQ